MKNAQILNFTTNMLGERMVAPAHSAIDHWMFIEGEEDEAILANSLAVVGSKNGISTNDLAHLFPAILRMLKNKSNWSK